MASEFIDKVLDKNPKAKRDEAIFDEALASIKVLRDLGIAPRGYDLQSPFKSCRFPDLNRHRHATQKLK